MSKNIMFKLGMGLIAVAAAVLWLLSVVLPETFGFFSIAWAITLFSGASAIMLLFKGLFGKNTVILKKFTIYFAAGLAVVCVLALTFAIAMPKNIVVPIIAIILTVGLLVGMLAVGGKKWDQGDNQNVGYKTYNQRKAEEEKKNAKNDDKKD